MGLSSNLKQALTKNALIHDAQGLLGGILYPLIPTILNQNGWTGVALALGGAWVTGAIFNLPGLRAGAMGSFATHVMYTHVNPSIKDVLGRPLFRFKPNTVLVYRNPTTGEEETLGDGLQENAQVVTLPTGEKVVGYNANGMSDYNLSPIKIPSSGINDYVNTPNGINDYVNTPNGINDYVTTTNPLSDYVNYGYNTMGDPLNKNIQSII